MNKLFILLEIILFLKSTSDFVDDNYSELINCIYADTNSCSSITLKTKNLECCLFKITFLENSDYDDDEDEDTKYAMQFSLHMFPIV